MHRQRRGTSEIIPSPKGEYKRNPPEAGIFEIIGSPKELQKKNRRGVLYLHQLLKYDTKGESPEADILGIHIRRPQYFNAK